MNEQSLPRILIIDDLFGRTLPQSRNEERANLCGQYLLKDLTNDEIGKGPVQLIKKPVAEVIFHRGQTPNCSSIGDTIKGLWTYSLRNPGTDSIRHSISNIVAPQVLQASIGAPNLPSSSPVTNALKVLLEAGGLLPTMDEVSPEPWVRRDVWQSDTIGQFILLDDMEDLGWADFLRGALELREGELLSYGEEKIDKFLVEQPFTRDGTVMFLDLRLFGRSPWSEEASFLRSLANYAEGQLLNNPNAPPPWFEEHEIASVRRCAGRSFRVEDADYHLALTFLPRIIAHFQPRLPIILFSSTGRREIVERLRAYGNIIADFEKPRFFGDSSASILWDTKRKFRRAIQSAGKIAKGRNLCSLLSTREPKASLSLSTPAVVEIYFDESGTAREDQFAVGGVAISFQNPVHAKQLDQLMRAHGLTWGLAQGFPLDKRNSPFPIDYLVKRKKDDTAKAYYEEKLSQVADCMEEVGAKVAAFCLVQDKPSFDGNALSWVTDELELDNRY
jgi:hypothetical protein